MKPGQAIVTEMSGQPEMLHHWPRLGVFDAGRLDWKKVRAGGFSAVFRKVNPCNYLRENSVVYGKCGSLTNEGLRAQLRLRTRHS